MLGKFRLKFEKLSIIIYLHTYIHNTENHKLMADINPKKMATTHYIYLTIH